MTTKKNKHFVSDIAKFHDYLVHDLNFLKEKVLYNDNIFTEFEKKEILESFLIKIIAEWDLFLEKSLIYLTKNDTASLSNFLDLTIPEEITFDTCQAIISGLNYFDIKNCSNLKKIAKNILTTANNPFPNIESVIYNEIDDLYIIRNYIAHKSKASKRSLNNLYKRKNRSEFVEPGYYLMEMDKKHHYWVNYISILMIFSVEIWKYVDSETYESIFKDGYTSTDALKVSLAKMKKYFQELKNGS